MQPNLPLTQLVMEAFGQRNEGFAAPLGVPPASAPLALSPQFSTVNLSLEDLRNLIRNVFALKTGREIQFGKFIHLLRITVRAQRGAWSRLFRGPDRVPFSKKSAENWSLIGQVWGSLNAQHVTHLGLSVHVLLRLSVLGADLLQQLILAGRVRSGLTEPEAKTLIEEYKPELKPESPLNVPRILSKIREQMLEIIAVGTPQGLQLAESCWRHIGEEIAAAKAVCRCSSTSSNFRTAA